jgi:hypothetical protein
MSKNMKFILIGLLKIAFVIITLPIVFIGVVIEVIALAGGYEGGRIPWIARKLPIWKTL